MGDARINMGHQFPLSFTIEETGICTNTYVHVNFNEGDLGIKGCKWVEINGNVNV